MGINEPPVAIKTIELSIIEEAFQRGWIRANPPQHRNGKKIAIIGSGPAGLAAAHQLNKAGYTVTVYERNDRIGGLLQYGIPTMKLNKTVIERRINIMAEEGINFNCGINVGVDVTGQFLLQTFDAICLALGATWPRDLKVPGRDLKGMISLDLFFLFALIKIMINNSFFYFNKRYSFCNGISREMAKGNSLQ